MSFGLQLISSYNEYGYDISYTRLGLYPQVTISKREFECTQTITWDYFRDANQMAKLLEWMSARIDKEIRAQLKITQLCLDFETTKDA